MVYSTLALAAYLLCVGAYGFITSRNAIRALMCLELMFNAVNLNFVSFATLLPETVGRTGHIFVLFILAIAAAEAAIGLAMIVNLYRQRRSIRLDHLRLLKW